MTVLINDIQDRIFTYQIGQLSGRIIQLVEKLTVWVAQLATEEQTTLNTVLNAILDSYSKKDYLLLADLLEFELKPLLGNAC